MQLRNTIFSLLIFFALSTPAVANIDGSEVVLGAHASMHTGTMDIVFEMNGVSPANDETISRVDLALPKEWTINNITATPANDITCQMHPTLANPPALDPNGDHLMVWEGNQPCPPYATDSIGTSTTFVANVTIPSCDQFPWTSNWRIFGGVAGFASGTFTINNCIQPTIKTLSGYKFTTLDHPNKGWGNYLMAINDKETITGSYSPANSPSTSVPFIYQNGGFQSVPVFINSTSTNPLGINENDKIAGTYVDNVNTSHGFTYSDTEGLVSFDFNEPGILETYIYGINTYAAMVYQVYNGSKYESVVDFTQFQTYPFLYPGTSVTAGRTEVSDINDMTTIVGRYVDSIGTYHGFIYKGGAYTDVMVPGSAETYINGISNNGKVAGYYRDGNTSHGFIFDGKSNYQTFDFPVGIATQAFDLNNNGTIVGIYFKGIFDMYGFVARPFNWSIFLPAIVTPK